MKRQTEKPSESGMRFFTPELYLRFNSANEDEADRANEAWEQTMQSYRRHLDGLRERLPAQVRKLSELCLHDAELLGLEQPIEPILPPPADPAAPFPVWSALGILSLKEDSMVVSLIYVLWDRMREHAAPEGWPFAKTRPHWLYDEIDVAADPRGTFLHRVLLSDGRVLEVPFVSVVVHRVPVPADEGGAARQSA